MKKLPNWLFQLSRMMYMAIIAANVMSLAAPSRIWGFQPDISDDMRKTCGSLR